MFSDLQMGLSGQSLAVSGDKEGATGFIISYCVEKAGIIIKSSVCQSKFT